MLLGMKEGRGKESVKCLFQRLKLNLFLGYFAVVHFL